MLTCFSVYKLLSLFLELNVCNQMLRGCVDMSICSYLVKSRILSAGWSQQYSRRSVVYPIRYPSDFRCIRVLNSALVGCARCTRFPKKYAHQNGPLNQGNLHELKLRLKIVRYPGIEVASNVPAESTSFLNHGSSLFSCDGISEITVPR